MNYAHKTIEDQKEKLATQEKALSSMKLRLDSAQAFSTRLHNELRGLKDEMEEEFNDLERRTRSYNIRVRGVPAEKVDGRSDHRTTVAEILVQNKLIQLPEPDTVKLMEIAHPLGKAVNGKYNLIAKFYARPLRNVVVKAAKQHRGQMQGAEKVTEDLTKRDRDRKTRAFPQMQRAYENGQRVKFHKGKLVIDGTITEIDE